MGALSFPFAAEDLPRPGDRERAGRGLERWQEALDEDATDPEVARFGRACLERPAGRALLEAVFGNSPFLAQCLCRAPHVLYRFAAEGADAAYDGLLADLETGYGEATDRDAVMRGLRRARRHVALVVALADITGQWPVEVVMGALSTFARKALSIALRQQLREGHRRGEIVLPRPDAPEHDSGFVIYGMGKLGAGELNYSSDIDLVVLFDDEKMVYQGKRTLQQFCVRVTQNLVKMLEERTGEGYVFRTDLRLRPDPASTPPALSFLAAETYYESLGQNWERAALIKARPVAGDIAAGRQFLNGLRPFIWRKYLDFAAIHDIHSIKRQINAHRGTHQLAGLPGHNVKLGRGGIREVEFFCQTQQLIWGGRQPQLRVGPTVQALEALVQAGHVERATARRLTRAYRFLRTVEHRLQMIDDQQTQEVPGDAERFAQVAAFMGYDDPAAFDADAVAELQAVEDHYSQLFAEAPALSEDHGNLVFTGNEDDPETLETLRGMGFSNPEAVAETIRGWHHGRYRATRSTRAREILTEIMPVLLKALGNTANPDLALTRFDAFLASLPAGVQLFALLEQNTGLLDLIAEILGDAPRLADHLARNPGVVENLLTGNIFEAPPGPEALMEELDEQLAEAEAYEDVLEITRRWAHGRRFQVGVQVLRRVMDGAQAGGVLSDIADAVLARLLPHVEAEFARKHGTFPGGGLAVMALGKLGGREMTAASDLDLILVYEVPEDQEYSDGAKPLAPTTYYTRLTQRFVNALTAMTPEGALYDVDMRLRPSGSAGPIAVSFEAFERYHREAAWTWEHMALTRARVAIAPASLKARVEGVIRDTLERPRDPQGLLRDVADMRARMDRDKPARGPWDIKYLRGGLVDMEFIIQYLQLLYGPRYPDILEANTAAALSRIRAHELLAPEDAATMLAARDLLVRLQGVLRLTVEGVLDQETASPGLRRLLAEATDSDSFEHLGERVDAVAAGVHDLFRRLIEQPAADLPPADDTAASDGEQGAS